MFPELTKNYCRNPTLSGTIWCYTTNEDARWEFCLPKGQHGSEILEKCPKRNIAYKYITYKEPEDEERILKGMRQYQKRAEDQYNYQADTIIFD